MLCATACRWLPVCLPTAPRGAEWVVLSAEQLIDLCCALAIVLLVGCSGVRRRGSQGFYYCDRAWRPDWSHIASDIVFSQRGMREEAEKRSRKIKGRLESTAPTQEAGRRVGRNPNPNPNPTRSLWQCRSGQGSALSMCIHVYPCVSTRIIVYH